MTMTVGSLFSGIGGLDLGLERAGMTVRWQCESDPYAARVLAKHWPAAPNLGDITAVDWSTVEPVDLICGGYPCQPFSLVGDRAGTDDARHLWPYYSDAVAALRPRWVLLENVPGHLSLGFGQVLGDLAELGFDAEWDCLPAAAVGAPHLRYRIFVVAHARSPRRRQDTRSTSGNEKPDEGRTQIDHHIATGDGQGRSDRQVADPDRQSPFWPPITREERHPWTAEPDVGRMAHGIPSRMDRLRCLGNAVVPQVAEWIGRRVMATRTGRP